MSLPHVRALFTELLELSAEDAQLPLEVLINLHRPQLRAPLLLLANRGEQLAPGQSFWEQRAAAREALVELCPILTNGRIFEGDPDLVNISNGITSNPSDMVWDLGMEQLRELTGSELLAQLADEASYDWEPQEPLYTLHRLTWPNAPVSPLAELLEAELAVDDEVAQAVLAVARGQFG
jgi:hypothetical protein